MRFDPSIDPVSLLLVKLSVQSIVCLFLFVIVDIAEHHLQTNHRIDWDSAECVIYSTDYYQRLTLESWFTNGNLEQTPLNLCQQLPAPYKRLINDTDSSFQNYTHPDDHTRQTRERKVHSRVYVLHKTLNLFISRCCFSEVPKCKMLCKL